MAPGLFIAGTDTGVGKSLLACTVVRALRAAKIDAVGFKPMASGIENGIWSDALNLYEASGHCEPLDLICPVKFQQPKAPTLAAQHENQVADMAPVRAAVSILRARHKAVVVEGVGGWLVPLDAQTLVADFAAELDFPVLLVCRAALGTINHTLLTLREMDRSKTTLAGIVMSVTRVEDGAAAEETRAEIERISKKKIAAIVPFIDTEWGTGDGPYQQVLAALNEKLDLIHYSNWVGC